MDEQAPGVTDELAVGAERIRAARRRGARVHRRAALLHTQLALLSQRLGRTTRALHELDTAQHLLRTAQHESDIDTPTPSRARSRPRWAMSPMSAKDLDAIRCAYADLNRRDVKAWLYAFDPNAEMYDLAGGLEGPPRRGHDALREWVADSGRDGKNGRDEPQEFIVAGDSVVVAVSGPRSPARYPTLTIDVVHVPRCSRCARAESNGVRPTSTRPRPSKPWGCRSSRRGSRLRPF